MTVVAVEVGMPVMTVGKLGAVEVTENIWRFSGIHVSKLNKFFEKSESQIHNATVLGKGRMSYSSPLLLVIAAPSLTMNTAR